MARITQTSYQAIIAKAWTYLLAGGGIVPGNDGDLEDIIGAIAAQHYDGTGAQAAFKKAVAFIDEHERHAAVETSTWSLVTAHQDAAFVFGCAVGLALCGAGLKAGTRKGQRQ
jgi:hypothetical protein